MKINGFKFGEIDPEKNSFIRAQIEVNGKGSQCSLYIGDGVCRGKEALQTVESAHITMSRKGGRNIVQGMLKGLSSDDGVFFGDSLNDQTMFKSFKNSVGVANISAVIDRLEFKPTTILTGDENVGPWGVLNYLKKTL